jgi:hypothetical protein
MGLLVLVPQRTHVLTMEALLHDIQLSAVLGGSGNEPACSEVRPREALDFATPLSRYLADRVGPHLLGPRRVLES